jgi:hypothetical protein
MFESFFLAFGSKSGKKRSAPTVQVADLELEERCAPAKYTWVGGAPGQRQQMECARKLESWR